MARVIKSSSLIYCSPVKTNDLASAKPPTIALADEPRPLPCGITFNALNAIPLGLAPMCSNPRSIDLITKFFESFLTSSAPSPLTSTSKLGSSKTCAAYRSRSSSANPKKSKPGPMFALLAGTLICAIVALKVRPLFTLRIATT
ncbi:unannotated protein [freshwater metagenome]|uniref:Unannotated protein n=1 Tax=freshwater metagenome TaxID=449393 RepID=A0A6J6FZL6_9ZZZZ